MRPKRILITGASSGIGQALALTMARKGHSVFMTGRRIEKIKETAIQSSTVVGELLAAELDVTQTKSIEKFFKEQSDWLSKVDVLVNNAGLALGRESFQESSEEDIESMIQTNVTGLLRMTRKVLPFMVKNKRGHILNLGSVAGLRAYAGGTVYCATKAAVHMMSEALRIDLGGTGVRVSTIAPGRVAETEFSNVRFKGDAEKAKAVYQGYRVMTAQDIADIAAWILDQPEHINVQELLVLPTDQPTASTLAPLKGV